MSERIFMTICMTVLIALQIVSIVEYKFQWYNTTIIMLAITILIYVFRTTRSEN